MISLFFELQRELQKLLTDSPAVSRQVYSGEANKMSVQRDGFIKHFTNGRVSMTVETGPRLFV